MGCLHCQLLYFWFNDKLIRSIEKRALFLVRTSDGLVSIVLVGLTMLLLLLTYLLHAGG